MKKLVIFGLMFSLFVFGGSKREVKNVHAAREYEVHFNDYTRIAESLPTYKDKIVNLKLTNEAQDLPAIYVERIALQTDIFAYIYKAENYTDSNQFYDCILYADAFYICAYNCDFMFANLTALKTIDISILMIDTLLATSMDSMFYNCYSLTELTSELYAPAVRTTYNMFKNCQSLKKLDISYMGIKTVHETAGMFENCSSLTELDLSNDVFEDTSNISDMEDMFLGCTSLKKLNISSFNITDKFKTCGLDLSVCNSLEYLEAPATIDASQSIPLPSQLSSYYGISSLNAGNISKYRTLCIPGDKFINNWKTLRTDGGYNGLCAALVEGSYQNRQLNKLIAEYDAFDADYKKYVNKAIDKENVTVGESITYLKNVLAGKQTTENDYGIKNGDAGSFMTMSITEGSPYLIAVISLIGVLSVVGYYFYNKKRNSLN